ncbi:MAG: VRR-NUC domain-containing protein [Gammaproteobacteria bacterium]|nr:VRR-NUC domain-containing protein [Gammaproteobacteria bacterium]
MQAELAPYYYLDHFQAMLDGVQARYLNLFSEIEQAWFSTWRQLDRDTKCAAVRLWMRTRPIVRSDKFDYAEIADLEIALTRLTKLGWLKDTPEIDFHTLAALASKAELLTLDTGLSNKLRKVELIQILSEQYCDISQPLSQWLPDANFVLLKLNHQDFLRRVQTLFFASPYQDLSNFVTEALGLTRYPPYPLSATPYYANRESLEAHLHLAALSLEWRNQHIDDEEYQLELRRYFNTEQRARAERGLCQLASRQMRDDPNSAQLSLEGCSGFEARTLRIQCLLATDHIQMAASELDKLKARCQTAHQHDQWRKLNNRRLKALGEPQIRAQPYKPPSRAITLDKTDQQRVEQDVIGWLAAEGWQGYWVESRLLNSIYGVALWPAIYADVDRAFDHPFQIGPRDGFSRSFQTKRQAIIDAALTEFCHASNAKLVKLFEQYQQFNNAWVNGYLEPACFEAAIASIDRRRWRTLIERLLLDPRAFRSGMPDLFAVSDAGQSRFIEVKGPGDQLQVHQRAWLEQLNAIGLSAEVINVKYRM